MFLFYTHIVVLQNFTVLHYDLHFEALTENLWGQKKKKGGLNASMFFFSFGFFFLFIRFFIFLSTFG